MSPETQQLIKKSRIIMEAVERAWELLRSEFSVLHFKVCNRIFYGLLNHVRETVLDSITNFLLVSDPEKKVDACRRFSILWKLVSLVIFLFLSFSLLLFLPPSQGD